MPEVGGAESADVDVTGYTGRSAENCHANELPLVSQDAPSFSPHIPFVQRVWIGGVPSGMRSALKVQREGVLKGRFSEDPPLVH